MKALVLIVVMSQKPVKPLASVRQSWQSSLTKYGSFAMNYAATWRAAVSLCRINICDISIIFLIYHQHFMDHWMLYNLVCILIIRLIIPWSSVSESSFIWSSWTSLSSLDSSEYINFIVLLICIYDYEYLMLAWCCCSYTYAVLYVLSTVLVY